MFFAGALVNVSFPEVWLRKNARTIEFAKALLMSCWVGGVCVSFVVRLYSRNMLSEECERIEIAKALRMIFWVGGVW